MIKRKHLFIKSIFSCALTLSLVSFVGCSSISNINTNPISKESKVGKKSEILKDYKGTTKDMPTKELVELFVNYPNLGDFALYSTSDLAIKEISKGFEPLRTLVTREDFTKELSNYYSKLNDKIKSLDKSKLSKEDINNLSFQSLVIRDILKSKEDKTLLASNVNVVELQYKAIEKTLEDIKGKK